ncbi:PRC-barrel domain-containing protein [Rhizobium sp. PAMB 3174]
MKRLFSASALTLVLVSVPAFAQDTAAPNTGMAPAQSDSATPDATVAPDATAVPIKPIAFIPKQEQGQWLVADYIGLNVQGNDGQTLGDISDIVVGDDGKISAFVISVGGFLGMGERHIAVPIDAVDQSTDENGAPKLVLASNSEALQNAPPFMSLLDIQREAERKQAEQESQMNAAPAAPTGQ